VTLPIALSPRPAVRRVWANFIGSGGSAGLPSTLVRQGSLEARLAVTRKDVRRAQRLRYRVFFEEGGAIADPTARLIRRDVCRFDAVCDHLLVVDHANCGRMGAPKVVGVYRLLRQDVAERAFGFASAGEFDVAALIARWPGARFLELGRACVAPAYRGRRVLDLLWRGIEAYARRHRMDALIGCASLPGSDVQRHAAAIRALAASRSDPRRCVAPTPESAAACDLDADAPADPRELARMLPPLVKGYWRLGATFSPVPAVDPTFGTTDLFVVLPLADIEARYLRHFGVKTVPVPITA
jgi:L-ornithine Nalpha-acyltransferase